MMIAKQAARTFCHTTLLALLAVAIGGGGGIALAASPSCTEVGATAGLRASPGDTASANKTITMNQADAENLKLGDVRNLAGACSKEVAGFELSLVYFRNGRLVEIAESGEASPVREGPSSGRFLAIRTEDEHPKWDRGDFVMATRVDTVRVAGGVSDYFIGVWKTRKTSTVGVFKRGPAGAFSTPGVLLTSSLPIRSVSYFPAPDAPAGRIGIVQESRAELRLVNVRWFHPQLTK